MNQEALRWLVCPRKEEARPCHGRLQVEQAMKLMDERVRVLKKGGLLLLSDPYDFRGMKFERLKTRSRKSPLRVIKQRIASRIRILQEEDDVPWISKEYNHCLAGLEKRPKAHHEERSNHAQA